MKDNNGWISFDDEMPPADEMVLFFVAFKRDPRVEYSSIEKMSKDSSAPLPWISHWRRIEFPEIIDYDPEALEYRRRIDLPGEK